MPELQLFKRRWHTATDALPVLMALLCIFHLLFFVPVATGAWSIEGTGLRYECNHATELRVANYSLLATFGLAALNEAILTVMGLRGGPFETRKRRFMRPLLYVDVALWVLLLGLTVYATVVTFSPSVSDACWSNNPCQYNPDVFPLACRKKDGEGIRDLSPACRDLLDVGPKYLDCWQDWVVYGANWAADTVQAVEQFVDNLLNMTGVVARSDVVASPNTGSTISTDQNEAAKLFLDWFLCYLYSIGEASTIDDLFTFTDTSSSDGVDLEQYVDDFVSDPASRNCSDLLARWRNATDFVPCNLTIDAPYWNETLGLDLAVSNSTVAQVVQSEGGAVYFDFPGVSNIQEYNEFLRDHPNVFQYMNGVFLEALNSSGVFVFHGFLHKTLTRAQDAFWFNCLPPTCQQQTYLADECTEWAQILSLPKPQNTKTFFEILVFTSWSVLCVTAAILFFCFNAFPDYNDVDSWEGTVRSLNRMCLCGGLADSATVGGSDMSVSHEIAKSLNLLFGGVDMDPTDRLLGVYLVSERQHRRRQQDILSALQQAGHITSSPRANSMLGTLSRFAPKRWRSVEQPGGSSPSGSGGTPRRALAEAGAAFASDVGPPLDGKTDDGSDAPQAVPLEGRPASSAPATRAAGVAGTAANGSHSAANAAGSLAAQVEAGRLPGSPFDTSSPKQLAAEAKSAGDLAPGSGPRTNRLLLYKHSMVRLATNATRSGANSAALVLAAVEEGTGAADADANGELPVSQLDAAEPETVLEDQRSLYGDGSSALGGSSTAFNGSGSLQTPTVKVVSKYRPMLTPSGCAAKGRYTSTPLSPQAAADIYAGKLDPVDHATLREAERISKFAVAAYGLQSVIWAQGKRPGMCLANANRLVKCFKRPLRLESRFRKRNFDAILAMTGVDPSDLLYVSYTNVAGGVLPYLIMLHRPSKSVVLSVRGTVSMEDMITDVLSNPVDVAGWLPDWVKAEAEHRRAAGIAGDASGDSLKAHIGIVSSATAILKDMEDRGLLAEILLSKLLRAATTLGRDTQEVIAEFLQRHKGELPSVPSQQQAIRATSLSSNPLAAAAAGEGLARASKHLGSGSTGGSGEPGAEFAKAERRHLSRLKTLNEEKEVKLPLERAQTILRSKLQLAGWKVVVTGHSLGAAVACMLGMQLRERFADLQCWAFNPPGGLLSWELATIAERFCTSVVVGKDVISRLSFNTSKRVVDEMVVSLARCTRPKLKVLLDVMLGRRRKAESTPDTFCKFDEIAPEALELVEQYYKASYLHMQTADTTEMYPPGKLIFLRPFKGKKKRQTVWDAVWIDAATLISEGILVTPTMMAHHRVFVLANAFESIFSGEAVTDAAAQEDQGEEDLLGTR